MVEYLLENEPCIFYYVPCDLDLLLTSITQLLKCAFELLFDWWGFQHPRRVGEHDRITNGAMTAARNFSKKGCGGGGI